MSCVQFSIRTSSVLICCTYLVFHAAFLVINFIILSNADSHLNQLATVTTNAEILDIDLPPSHLNAEDAEKYLLLPILINIFLIISNLLAAWGALILNHLLLLPWLALYFSYILFAFGLLLYMVIVLYHVWFKIVIFLIITPILILAIIFWLTLLELYFLIKIHRSKKEKLARPQIPTLPPVRPVREKTERRKHSFMRGVHRPLFRRSRNKTNLRHRSYRHRQGRRRPAKQSTPAPLTRDQREVREEREEREVGPPREQCEDSLEEDHYQEAESHYQTPKMSRCPNG